MNVRITLHGTVVETRCALCDHEHIQDLTLIQFVDDRGQPVGQLCPDCFAAGPGGAIEQARQAAMTLYARANALSALASQIGRETAWSAPPDAAAAQSDVYQAA